MKDKLKNALMILCPIVGLIAGLIAIINGLIDRKTKKISQQTEKKRLESWQNPNAIYQNIGIGMEIARSSVENKKTSHL